MADAERAREDRSRRRWTSRRPPWTALALLGVLALAYLLHLREWLFLCDDAFISFRYARNLGEQGALVYNLEPLERVEGYTNLLWVLILAAGVVVGLSPEQLAPALTGLAGVVSLVLVACIGAQLRRREAGASKEPPLFEVVDLLAPALLVTLPEFVVWGSSGLETGFAVALGLVAVWAWLDGRIVGAAAFAALAGLTRPDALVWIGAFGLGWLVVELAAWILDRPEPFAERLRGLPWARVGVGALVFVALLGAQLWFRRSYYGEWLPNTWAVKHHGALLRDHFGRGYVAFWTARTGVKAAVLLVPLVLLQPKLELRAVARALGTLVLVAVPVVAMVGYVWSVGGDFMAHGRFLLPATVLSALVPGLLLARVHRFALERGAGPGLAAGAWAVAAALLVGLSASRIPARIAEDRDHAHLHIAYDADGRPLPDTPGFEGVQAMDRFAAVRLAAGAELAERVPAETWISVGAAGALPYASRLPAFDAYGLVDPGVLEVAEPATGKRARPGHQLHAPLSYMRSREPDLMCHIGWEAPRPPTLRDARRRARGPFAWACVETGPIADRRAEGGTLESRYYCCLRERGGDPALEALDPAKRGRP